LGCRRGYHSLCLRVDSSIRAFAFWGYCNLPQGDPPDWWSASHDLQMQRILEVANSEGPQFVLSYFRLPEHTPPSFDNSDQAQRQAYADGYVGRSNRAAALLADLVATLQDKDPGAMIFVFGDHGPRLSYNTTFEDDPDFFVKDSLGVLGGIFPRDACEPWFDETLAEPYLTILDAVHTILRCLSGGEEALVEPLAAPGERNLSGYHGIPDDAERSFADYLYE